jgi:hypothetical protein
MRFSTFRFSFMNNFPGLLSIPLGPFQNFTTTRLGMRYFVFIPGVVYTGDETVAIISACLHLKVDIPNSISTKYIHTFGLKIVLNYRWCR